jgi:hypothetical protein
LFVCSLFVCLFVCLCCNQIGENLLIAGRRSEKIPSILPTSVADPGTS